LEESLLTEDLFIQSMIDDSITMATLVFGYNQRLPMVTIILASIAFLLVITSVTAFIYVIRKGNLFK
jgi:hypothetical protein